MAIFADVNSADLQETNQRALIHLLVQQRPRQCSLGFWVRRIHFGVCNRVYI
jgi:hypothetical protein